VKKIDLFIIKKFLSTFFFILGLIMVIAMIFDVSEKIDDFINNSAPIKAILLDYYVNFIFFYGNLFSPLIIFLSVIIFTSTMASRSEIISILASGVSFNRLLLPYFVAATLLASIALLLNHYLVPNASKERLQFEWTYINNPFQNRDKHIHRQVRPGEYIYMDNYRVDQHTGYKFSYEKFDGNQITYKLMSEFIRWDTINKNWIVELYTIRTIDGTEEHIEKGKRLDTAWNFSPVEFEQRQTNVQMMTTPALNQFIEEARMKGSELIPFYLIEKHQRSSYPFATYILTLIGVSVASRKVRGGIGLHIAISIGIILVYIMAMQVSTVFARNAGFSPFWAVWTPNIIFGALGVYLYRKAPK